MEKCVTFKSRNEAIFANLGIPREGAPCVIMSHGMEGSKDGKKWLLLASRLYKAGFAYLRFNYRSCGAGEEISQGRFEDTTLSRRIQDYRAAVNFVEANAVDKNRLAVVGSSLGGTVAIAAREGRIKAMVTLATPCRFNIPYNDVYKVYKGKRYFELPSGSKIKREFFTDISEYNICGDAGEIGCPLLVIHGDNDDIVPLENAHRIYEKANEPKRLEIIKGGNHSLDGLGHMERIAGLTIDWFRQYL